MASKSTDVESAVSTLNFLFHGHLVTYCIHIACKLNIAGVIAEAGRALSLQELEEKIHGEVNLSYLKRFVNSLNSNVEYYCICNSWINSLCQIFISSNIQPSRLSG